MRLESWLPGRLRVGVEALLQQAHSLRKVFDTPARPVFQARHTPDQLRAFSQRAGQERTARLESAQGTHQGASLRAVFRDLEVLEVQHPTPDAVTLWLRQAEPITFRPGQFLNLIFTLDGREVRRAYSICSDPSQTDRLALTIKRVEGGLVSNHILNTVRAGDRLKTLGPNGGFGLTAGDGDGRHVVLIGAGSGITPLYSVLQAVLRAEPRSRVTLIYGNQTPEAELFRAALDALAAQYAERLTLLRHYSRAAGGGRLDEALLSRLLPTDADAFLVCGPKGVLEASQAVLERAGAWGRAQVEQFVAQSSGEVKGATGAIWSVRLARSGKLLMVPDNQTLLEAGRAAGVAMPFSCTLGGCGACRVQKLEGEVALEAPNCLSKHEQESGACLTCVGRPRSAVVLDI